MRRRVSSVRAVSVVGKVALGQDHDRPHLTAPHQRQVTLEAAQVEISIEAHDEQRSVDVAHQALTRAVGGASDQMVERRHAGRHPHLTAVVVIGEHPVTNRKVLVDFGEFTCQGGPDLRTVFIGTVVQQSACPMHFEDAHCAA